MFWLAELAFISNFLYDVLWENIYFCIKKRDYQRDSASFNSKFPYTDGLNNLPISAEVNFINTLDIQLCCRGRGVLTILYVGEVFCKTINYNWGNFQKFPIKWTFWRNSQTLPRFFMSILIYEISNHSKDFGWIYAVLSIPCHPFNTKGVSLFLSYRIKKWRFNSGFFFKWVLFSQSGFTDTSRFKKENIKLYNFWMNHILSIFSASSWS